MHLHSQTSPSPRVLVLDDHQVIRESLAALLRREGMTVVGEFSSGQGALNCARSQSVDVAIVDVLLEPEGNGMDGMEAIRQLRSISPAPQVMVLSSVRDPRVMEQAYGLGVAAYVQKTHAGRDLLLRTVHALAGSTPAAGFELPTKRAPSPAVQDVLNERNVTAREREVLAYVGTGAENLQIAAWLKISERTVKAHVSALYRKLLARHRAELALLARDLGMKDPRNP